MHYTHLNEEEIQAVIDAMANIEQPFIDPECERALATGGMLVHDAGLAGRPVSSTYTAYLAATFGYMGGGVVPPTPPQVSFL